MPTRKIVEVLDLGARNNLKMVLATKPAKAPAPVMSPDVVGTDTAPEPSN